MRSLIDLRADSCDANSYHCAGANSAALCYYFDDFFNVQSHFRARADFRRDYFRHRCARTSEAVPAERTFLKRM